MSRNCTPPQGGFPKRQTTTYRSTQQPLVLLFNPHCFTSLEVTYNILNLSKFSHCTWRLPLPLGYTCTVPKTYQAHSCTTGMVFSLQHHRARKSRVVSLEREDSQVLIRQTAAQDLPIQRLSSMSTWYFSVIFDILYVLLHCLCTCHSSTVYSESHTTVAIVDIYAPGIKEQFTEKEVKHLLLEL